MRRDSLEEVLHKLDQEEDCTQEELVQLLSCSETNILERLFLLADRKRKKYVGDAVHLRGLIEFSNFSF